MWEQIRTNRNKSLILVTVIAVILLLLGYVLGWFFFDAGWAGLGIAFLVWAFMGLLAYFQGDGILITMSGAIKVDKAAYPRLHNIVEEMKIASGLPVMPYIYIIHDQALNAFATGTRTGKASIAVTLGLVKNLDRDELQGVIGHEIAHIKNRDVLLMSMCSIMLGSIVTLSCWAKGLFLFGGKTRFRIKPSRVLVPQQILIFVLSILLVLLAPVIARLIYFTISRKREYLADASSALYTRYPEGLASALEKISAPGWLLLSASEVSAPMYVVNPFGGKGRYASGPDSTHPPVAERIHILHSMVGGASFNEYDKVYRHGTSRG